MNRTILWQALAAIYGYQRENVYAMYGWVAVIGPDGRPERDHITGRVVLKLVPGGVPQV